MPDPQWLQAQHDHASAWAKTMLNSPFLILDSETTGLSTTFDEIVQLAVISSRGEVLLDSLIQPRAPARLLQRNARGMCAADIHGITPDRLTDAPRFPEVYAHLSALVQKQRIVIYNAQYDRHMLRALCRAHQLPDLHCAGIDCAMLYYAAWHGAWDDVYQSFTWQKLTAAAARWDIQVAAPPHSALGDCWMTLKVMEAMALALPYRHEEPQDKPLPPLAERIQEGGFRHTDLGRPDWH